MCSWQGGGRRAGVWVPQSAGDFCQSDWLCGAERYPLCTCKLTGRMLLHLPVWNVAASSCPKVASCRLQAMHVAHVKLDLP